MRDKREKIAIAVMRTFCKNVCKDRGDYAVKDCPKVGCPQWAWKDDKHKKLRKGTICLKAWCVGCTRECQRKGMP